MRYLAFLFFPFLGYLVPVFLDVSVWFALAPAVPLLLILLALIRLTRAPQPPE